MYLLIYMSVGNKIKNHGKKLTQTGWNTSLTQEWILPAT